MRLDFFCLLQLEVKCLFLRLPAFLVQMQSTRASRLPFSVSGQLHGRVR